jgi:phospholipid/cholesterol/gamma-HCH transport system substrate-binding protein
METRAHYIAVGAFVLSCAVGLVVAVLWLAGAQYNQEYAYYQTFFKGPVTGLGKGTITRYNGIEVGRVAALAFNPNDPQSVIVTLQVQPELNIRADSVASIESQGLTGGTYVEISGGTKASPLLVAKTGQRYPVIRARQSTLQQLEQSAPELVAKLNVVATRVNDLLNDDNRREIGHILVNLDNVTTTLSNRSSDIDTIIRNTNQATARLNDATVDIKPTLAAAQVTLGKFGRVADDADALVNSDGITQLPELVSDSRRLIGSVTKLSDRLNRDPSVILFGDRRKGYEPK